MYEGRYEPLPEPKDRSAHAPFAALLARDDWPVLVGLPAISALFVFAVPELGWWALAMAAVVYTAGFVAFSRARRAHAARDQLATTLGRLPEIEGTVRQGHAARTAELAKGMAHVLELGAQDIAAAEAAARTRSVGWVGRDEPPHTRPGYGHAAAARWSALIVGQVDGFDRVASVVGAATPDEPANLALLRSVVETAASYDDATEGMGMRPEDAVAVLEADVAGPVTAALRSVLGLVPAD